MADGDSLLGFPNFGSSDATYGGLLNPAQQRQVALQQIIGTLAGAGAAGQPSRLPVPLGMALGRGALEGQEAGNRAAQQYAGLNLLGPRIEGEKIQNALNRLNLQGWEGILGGGGAPGTGIAPSLFAPPSASSSVGAPQAMPVSAPGTSAQGMTAPTGSPPLLTGSTPPSTTSPLSGPLASSGSSAPPSPVPASGPMPILDPASLIARAQQYARFPAGLQTANQLLTMAQHMMPPGTMLMSDGSVALPKGADVAKQTEALAGMGFVRGTDGHFHPDPGFVAGKGQIASAEAWAKVAPELYEKTHEPFSLSRQGETRWVVGRDGVPRLAASNPYMIESVGAPGTPNEGVPIHTFVNSPATASAPGQLPQAINSQLPVALQRPNNPPSVFNQPSTTAPNATSNGMPQIPSGLPPARKEAEVELGKDFADKDKKAFEAANQTVGSIQNMVHSFDVLNAQGGWMNTGAGNNFRTELAKIVNSWWPGEKPPFDANQIANWESLNKNTRLMGLQVVNQYLGGSREAASIIEGTTSAVPNSENTPLGGRLVASGIEQMALRQRQLYAYKAGLLANNRPLASAEADFNEANPVQAYTMRAIANAVPDGAVRALMADPSRAKEFDSKYGKEGLAEFVLGGRRTTLGAGQD